MRVFPTGTSLLLAAAVYTLGAEASHVLPWHGRTSPGFVDALISSCFVHLRKPEADIFRLALDIAQAPARQVVYIENTPMCVRIAEGLGIKSILHTDCTSTCAKLASCGLQNDVGGCHP